MKTEQRVIKFRAWDKYAKMMRDDGVHPDGNPHMKYDVGIMASCARNEWATGVDGLEIRVNSESFILMQFTGLKDKNGVDIYEGDIMNYKRDKVGASGWYVAGTFGHHPDNAIQVIWDDDSWWVQGNSRFARLNETITFNNNLAGWEVIGNIYQHPDLLK